MFSTALAFEFRDHLFFGSSFTKRVWEITINLFLVSFAKTDWQDITSQGEIILKEKA